MFSTFRICRGYEAPTTLDLAHLPTSASAIEFSTHIKEVHDEVRKRLEATHSSFKDKIDPHRREQELKEGDWVLVYRNRRLHPKKLQIRRSGPYQINKVVGDNAYHIALPPESNMSSTVNTTNLLPYVGPTTSPTSVPQPCIVQTKALDIPQTMLDAQTVPTPRPPIQ